MDSPHVRGNTLFQHIRRGIVVERIYSTPARACTWQIYLDLSRRPLVTIPFFLEMGSVRPFAHLLGPVLCRPENEEYLAGDYCSFYIKRISPYYIDHGNFREALK